MKPLRSPLRTLALLFVALIAAVISLQSPSTAFGQAGMNHGDRQGLIGIRNEAERQAFANLACSCGGCPHESILTCPCSFADGFRDEVRAMISKGMTLEEIKVEWAKRYGSDALTVPSNKGGGQFLYVVPLVLIVAAAAFVIFTLRRFRRRDEEKNRAVAAAVGAPASDGAHDDYDDKLDDELKQLDREE